LFDIYKNKLIQPVFLQKPTEKWPAINQLQASELKLTASIAKRLTHMPHELEVWNSKLGPAISYTALQTVREFGAFGELQMRSRGANSRSHTSFLSLVPPSKWDTWFGGSRSWHCWLASKNRTLHL